MTKGYRAEQAARIASAPLRRIALLVLALCSNGTSFAVGFVQGAATSAQGPQSRIVTALASTQSADDLNVVFIGWENTEAHVTAVTDTTGNTYVLANEVSLPGVATQVAYYAKRILPAAKRRNAVTVVFDAEAGRADVRVAEYSGLDTNNPLDLATGAGGVSITVTGTELVPTHLADLLVASAFTQHGNEGSGPGYAQRFIDSAGEIIEDQIVSAAGSHRATAPQRAAGWFLMQTLALRVATGGNLRPPYPASQFITGMSWDFSTVLSHRKAIGSDLWPLAWGGDGNLYGAWGDGGGFDGTEDGKANGRASLGFARITGTPLLVDPGSFAGRNLWGQAPAFAPAQASFGGKVSDLISVGGILYGWGGLWTASNCGCPDPTLKSGDNPTQRTLVWSPDYGLTWHIAPWTSSSQPGAALQFGQNYGGAFDPAHVYFHYQRDKRADPANSYLRRVLTTELAVDPATAGHFEYFIGTDSNGNPQWSPSEAQAIAVFNDPNIPPGVYSGPAVVYDAALKRYLATAFHGPLTGQLGFFESPTPWGPWATIGYYEDWGGFNETAGEGNGLSFPAKWISSDGRTLWAVFSGASNGGANNFDSFNVARVILSVAGGT